MMLAVGISFHTSWIEIIGLQFHGWVMHSLIKRPIKTQLVKAINKPPGNGRLQIWYFWGRDTDIRLQKLRMEPLFVDTSVEYELDMTMFPGWHEDTRRHQPKLLIHAVGFCSCGITSSCAHRNNNHIASDSSTVSQKSGYQLASAIYTGENSVNRLDRLRSDAQTVMFITYVFIRNVRWNLEY